MSPLPACEHLASDVNDCANCMNYQNKLSLMSGIGIRFAHT